MLDGRISPAGRHDKNAFSDIFKVLHCGHECRLYFYGTKIDECKAEAKIEYYKTIEALQKTQDEARAKPHEKKTSGDESRRPKDRRRKGLSKSQDCLPRGDFEVQMSHVAEQISLARHYFCLVSVCPVR